MRPPRDGQVPGEAASSPAPAEEKLALPVMRESVGDVAAGGDGAVTTQDVDAGVGVGEASALEDVVVDHGGSVGGDGVSDGPGVYTTTCMEIDLLERHCMGRTR